MRRFTITYTVKYELSTYPYYVWNKNDECFNLKTGRRIRQVEKNGCYGYCINGKFINKNILKPLLRKPQKSDCPF